MVMISAVNTSDVELDEAEPSEDPDRTADATPRWRRTRWVFTRHLCFGGLVGGLVLFCLSMTPSLVPRLWLFQGTVSGISVAVGYGLGSAASSGLRKLLPREPTPTVKRNAWWVLLGSTLMMGGLFLYYGSEWQQQVRRAMGMDQLRATEWLAIVLSTATLAYLLVVLSRATRGATRVLIRLLDKIFPHQVTVIGSIVTVALVISLLLEGVLFNGMIGALNRAYALTDKGTSPWIAQPVSTRRTGGPGSLVAWESLGVRGRDFTGDGGGPTVSEIEAFTGVPAIEPIRVYVGLRSADTLDERIDLALAELERTGAFERSVLVVDTTTGTGWVDENVADSLEFLHNGDTAQVAMQYSYLPSWVSFLVDRSEASSTGEQLITAVVDRVNDMNPADRPKLFVFGESLGSFGTESAFTSPRNLLSNVDGALLVGPTFVNPLHGRLTSGRDPGSPVWRPLVNGGRSFRFAVGPGDLTDAELFPAGQDWEAPRVVYLQNSSDPITYFDPDLLLSKPAWLRGQRGPDVSEDMVWIPVITFWQVAADMAFSMGVPAGHGHRYGANVVDGWVQVDAPDGWSDADTAALRALIDDRADERSAKKQAAGG
jgi:uncharacterized membrane protein